MVFALMHWCCVWEIVKQYDFDNLDIPPVWQVFASYDLAKAQLEARLKEYQGEVREIKVRGMVDAVEVIYEDRVLESFGIKPIEVIW